MEFHYPFNLRVRAMHTLTHIAGYILSCYSNIYFIKKAKDMFLLFFLQPSKQDELLIIKEKGGKVINWNGARVLGVLAMFRKWCQSYKFFSISHIFLLILLFPLSKVLLNYVILPWYTFPTLSSSLHIYCASSIFYYNKSYEKTLITLNFIYKLAREVLRKP